MSEEIKPDRVIFKQVFPTGMNYLPIHFGAEYPVLPGQDKDEVMKAAVEQIRKWNLEYNPGMAVAMEYAGFNYTSAQGLEVRLPELQVEKSTKESATQRIIDQINQCSDSKVLESFKLLAGTNPEIKMAYDYKLKELQ